MFSVYIIFDRLEQFFSGQLTFGADSLMRKLCREAAKLVCGTLEQPEEKVNDATNKLNTVRHELALLEVETIGLYMGRLEEDKAPMGRVYC